MVQDTGVKELSENEALIEETLRQTPVEVLTEIEKNPVIHKGDDELDAPMVLGKVSNSGYVYLWDTETRERVPILRYMLGQQMRKKRADGQFRFSATKPKEAPWRGAVKCMLHKDNPQRKEFDSFGFRTCRKENIASPHALTQHMRLKHPQEWKHIEAEREKREKEQDRELQRAILGKIGSSNASVKLDAMTSPLIDKVIAEGVMERVAKDKGGIDATYLKRVENMRKAREAKNAKA